MATSPCVILYGNSVFLAGIRADLAERARVEVLAVEPGCPDTAAIIRARRPAALVFDLSATQPHCAVSLLRDDADLVLIGVDPSSDRLLVLSGRHEQPESAAGLVQAIIAASAARPAQPHPGAHDGDLPELLRRRKGRATETRRDGDAEQR